MADKCVLTLTQKATFDTVGVNPFNNVFAYEMSAGTGTTLDLREIFVANILVPLLAIQSTQIQCLQIYTINLDDPLDFDLHPITTAGDLTGDMLPVWVAYKFRYVRTSRTVNDGAKRFVGVPEGVQNAGVVSGGTFTNAVALAGLLGGLLTGAGDDYIPRIWRRAGDYAPYTGTPPVGTPYPDTFYAISGVQFQQTTSQNSRKR